MQRKAKIFKDKQDFVEQYRVKCKSQLGKEFEDLSEAERFFCLAKLVSEKAREDELTTHPKGEKKVYYFSLEFLLGPLLDNYLLNYGVRDIVAGALKDMREDLDDLARQEADPGLGNGGLGRLAACFLDSMAHEGVAGYGNGMRYQYGLFRQAIEGGRQVEKTDNWLEHGYPWEIRKNESAVTVQFGGTVVRHEDNGYFWFTQEGGEYVKAVPYDVPIVGYGGKKVNELRLWKAEPSEDNFDLDAFNNGDYTKAFSFRSNVEAISTILYPNDAGEHGRMLRLKQEYLFVSAGLQSILRAYEREYGPDAWEDLPKHVAVHTNDTHPAMCGPELMRILVDDKRVDFDLAYKIARETCSYTNHTVMPEALEKWPINMFRTLLPRLYMVIEEIDRRYRDNFPRTGSNWSDALKNTAILWDGQVRMANLSVIFSHSVNGVSALHTKIIEDSVLNDFYKLEPEKFNNKTNGVSHRRFLGNANLALSSLITKTIGDGWYDDAMELEKLAAYENDTSFLEEFGKAKQAEKERLARYVKEVTGEVIDTSTVFDTQVKRFHAYKRQLLNVFKILDIYNRMINDGFEPQPTTFIFSGKAAQSYTFAKEVIRLINSVADVINHDERVNKTIKVIFIPNFAVSNAQIIYPATEISEQISTAGTEASGTSNMKFMMNGAITLGTYDGSNVEISDLVGDQNIKIFGLRANEVEVIREGGRYFAWNEYNADRARLGRVVDMLTDGSLAHLSGNFESVHDELMVNNDQYLVLRDFHSYVQAWEELVGGYSNTALWNKMALHNTAKAGYFSSDRTIRSYASEIWHIEK
ncbi:MAG: glycogen/starch/alpha-glucan phosphorylase [Atopobiaceae bacterium]|jgi:starch phosphorylase